MSECKHENADHVRLGECVATMEGVVFVERALCEQFRCLDCKAWLPLGKANDEPEAVRVEMRAAEIAATGRPLTMDDCSPGSTADCAACGFVDNKFDAPTFVSERAGYWAGWLAAVIATHEEP